MMNVSFDMVQQIRSLHRAQWHGEDKTLWLECPGCDVGAYADGPPDWPCRTAEIVFSRDEIKTAESEKR